MPQRRWSLVAVWALCALLLGLRTTQPVRHAFTWDVFGYYLYLPATFIHHDPGLRNPAWLEALVAEHEPSATLYQLVDGPEGGRVIKYSSGMALAYAPFFAIAHALAGPLGFPADGFSAPYRVAVTYGMLLWVMLGIFLFRRLLLNWFDERTTAVLMVLVVLGTNFLHLAALDGTLLTHPLLFTLYAALALATQRWHRHAGLPAAVAVGALAGWITLVRPSEGVCLLIPLLWAEPSGWRAKWRMVADRWPQAVLAVTAFVVMASPQLAYWRHVTGEWLFYSYINPGEGFDFGSPHTWDFLFSFRKGWFVYTPLALVMVAGLGAVRQRARHLFWPLCAYLAVDLYVVSSWTNWWYAGGSFSARSMMPAYALLAVPLGFALTGPGRRTMLAASAVLVVLNLFQTWQWSHGILSKERMTAGYYTAVFCRTAVPAGADALLLVDRPLTEEEALKDESGYHRSLLYRNTFDDRPEGVCALSPADPFTPGPDVPFRRLTGADHAWLRISARLWVTDSTTAPPILVATFHHKGETYKYRAVEWDLSAAAPGEWCTQRFDYITPEVRSMDDNLKVYVWNQAGGAHIVDDLQVELFGPK
jgi:hypothetical protein